MLNFEIDKEKLRNGIEKISDWEDWDKIASEIFRVDEWEETDIDIVEEDLERLPIIINESEWISTTNSYDISPEIFHLYEKIRWQVFAKLEPDADKDNKSHPELYGKWCVYCKVWAREFPQNDCPICGNELLPIAIND